MTQEQLEADFLGSSEYINDHGGRGGGWFSGMYHDLLGRAPDAEGLDAWFAELQAAVDPVSVALRLAASSEREAKKNYQRL